jgi:hypothetical protein
MQSGENSIQYTLWERIQIYQGVMTAYPLSTWVDCDYTKQKIQTCSAFAILCVATLLLSIIFSVLDAMKRPTHRWATEISAGCAAAFGIILIGVFGSVFNEPICTPSGFIPIQSGWVLGSGFVCFIVAVVLLIPATLVMFFFKYYIRPECIETAQQNKPDYPPRRRKSKRSFVSEDGRVTAYASHDGEA